MSRSTVQLQLALDFVDLSRALRVAEVAVPAGIDIVEAGTPLIKSEGLDAVRRLREAFPGKRILADLKTADAGRIEMEMAAKAGADMAICLGSCTEPTIREAIDAGHNYGIEVGVDVLGVTDYVELARRCEQWGAAFINVHLPIDEQMQGVASFEKLRKIAAAVAIPVAAAGGINSQTVVEAVEAGARMVIVGGAITKATDPAGATADIRRAIDTGAAVPTELFQRASGAEIREVLERVSTANVSMAAHNRPSIPGLRPIWPGARLCGRVLTVRTAPGDFAKPVLAIDRAEPGDVIVIDAGGRPPAVWGELASHSAVNREVAGVVIDGAIRDTSDIIEMRFPAFASCISSHAGEAKGFGEIGQPISVGGQRIETGDWIVADDDGVMVLPAARAVELANRAQDVLERENRQRQEMADGKTTLGHIAELARWEKIG